MNNDQIKEKIGLLKNIVNYLAASIIGLAGWLFINLTIASINSLVLSISLIFYLILITVFITQSIGKLISNIGEKS